MATYKIICELSRVSHMHACEVHRPIKFHQFSRFPQEIQDRIAILASNPRVIIALEDVDTSQPTVFTTVTFPDLSEGSYPLEIYKVTYLGAKRPVTAALNRKLGEAVKSEYKILRYGGKALYFSPSLDTVELRTTLPLIVSRQMPRITIGWQFFRRFSMKLEDFERFNRWAFSNIVDSASLEEFLISHVVGCDLIKFPVLVRLVFELSPTKRNWLPKLILEDGEVVDACDGGKGSSSDSPKLIDMEWLSKVDQLRLNNLWMILETGIKEHTVIQEDGLEVNRVILPRVVLFLHVLPMSPVAFHGFIGQ